MQLGGTFSLEIISSAPGISILKVTGKDADKAFKNESGGHRWQRVPPTEKAGRVHTSTITVVVIEKSEETKINIQEKDLVWRTCRGSGAGGQHRNKTESAVQLTHIPTGITVRSESDRSQHRNRSNALEVLEARLTDIEMKEKNHNISITRKNLAGSGMRGDKIRTIALQRDQVIDHRSGKRMLAKNYLRGHLEDII